MNALIFFNKEFNNWSITVKEVDRKNHKIQYKTYDNFPTQESATIVYQAKEDQFQKEMEQLKKITNVKYTLTSYLEYWFEDVFLNYAEATSHIGVVKWAVYKIIIPCIEEDYLISNVTAEYINCILKKCASLQYKTAGNVAKKTLTIALKNAIAEKNLIQFDFEALDLYPDVPAKYVRYSSENLRILLTEAKQNEAHYLEILLCLFVGLRTGEIRGLSYSNIDFAERTITVNQQIVDKSFTIEKKNGVVKRISIKDCVKPPKSISSYRTIKVPSFIMDELRIRKKENETYFQTHPKANTYWKDYVCVGKGGEIKSPNTIANALKRICSGNGLPQISPHGLRHMCATILLESGKDLDFISHVLGHKSVTTTFDIYCGDMDGFSSIQKLLSNQLDPINKFETRLEKVV